MGFLSNVILLACLSLVASDERSWTYSDQTTSQGYGKYDWDEVERSQYYFDWERYINYGSMNNECDWNGKKQSPVNIVEPSNDQCTGQEPYDNHRWLLEHGDCHWEALKWEIKPWGLYMEFPMPDNNDENFESSPCRKPSLNSSGGYKDRFYATHVTLKAKSEHYLLGRQYDAEINIAHTRFYDGGFEDPNNETVFMMSILVNAAEGNSDNPIVEPYLREWQRVFDNNTAQCAARDFLPQPVVLANGTVVPYDVWTIISVHDFESEYGIFDDGGANSRINEDSDYANSGSKSISIRAGNDTSMLYQNVTQDVSAFDKVRVSFWFMGNDIEDGESFALEFSPNNGESWQLVKQWVVGTADFPEMNTGYSTNMSMPKSDYNLTEFFLIRFRCEAGSEQGELFIDDVEIAGSRKITVAPSASPSYAPTMSPTKSSAPSSSPTTLTPTTSPTGSDFGWTLITSDDFESGYGNFQDGGENSALINDISYAHSGNTSAKIGDGSSTSMISFVNDHDVEAYGQLRVKFWYISDGGENDESFALEYSSDSGSSWKQVQWLDLGSNNTNVTANNVFFQGSAVLDSSSYNFTEYAKIRFMSEASGQGDVYYIDDVTFEGRPNKSRRTQAVPSMTNAAKSVLRGTARTDSKANRRRKLQDDGLGDSFQNGTWAQYPEFDVYSLLTTPWFYRYRGSLTMPQCFNNVLWRVLEQPLEISIRQREMIDQMISYTRDPVTCQLATIGAPRGDGYVNVNRPLQQLNETLSKLMHCDKYNFRNHGFFEYPRGNTAWDMLKDNELAIPDSYWDLDYQDYLVTDPDGPGDIDALTEGEHSVRTDAPDNNPGKAPDSNAKPKQTRRNK